MRSVALGITATVVLPAVTALLVAVSVWGSRGPMNHGWDWPWHDWWHSRWEHSRLHQDVPHANQRPQMLERADGQTTPRATKTHSTQSFAVRLTNSAKPAQQDQRPN